VSVLTTSSSWVEHAACRGHPSSWWFAGEASFEHRIALRICGTCTVRAECLADAQRAERDQVGLYGVRGGLSASARRAEIAQSPTTVR
jgi:Transcription factor WhiB